ncbi:hypothetical protein BGZ52_004722 [Haplosporangium bisporale]|nr:hypothetical protein BGZ52_004722 [Haplosporangium bisporale]KAF9211084.1 hypothetical protein BGZ59_008551 [Podila verticillata]
MSLELQQPAPEPMDEVVIEEAFNVTTGPEPTAAILSVLPPAASASATAKTSRLSTAFKRISNGCGLCIHPFRNSGPTDYHALVHTPTDETPETFLNSYDVAPISVPEPKSGNSKDEMDIAGSSAAVVDNYSEIHYHRETKVDESQDVHQGEQQDQFTFVEEITVMSSANDDVVANNTKAEEEDEAQIERLEETVNIVERTVADEETAVETAGAAITSSDSTAIEETSLSPVSPAPVRTNGTFAKFTKRSTSSSAVSASAATSSTTSSSTPSSPLLERLGRFAKIIRPSETTSSSLSKVESLKVSAPLTTEAPVTVPKAEVESKASSKISAQPDIHVDIQEAVLTDSRVVEAKEETISSIEETTTTTWTNATPPLPPQPQQQQTYNRRDSLALDSTAAKHTALPRSQPMAIPGQSQLIHPWTHSPTTLHQKDASSSSNPSLVRTGRTSTIDSTLEGGSEAGSADSGNKEASKVTKRRKSVLKKLSKIINNMNTNRRNSGDSKESRAEKRISRQGSQTMESPIEADESFGLNK